MAIDTTSPAAPNERKPMLRVWGTGPMRSILFGSAEKASTALVPRINMSAMTGAAIRTERPMFRAGARLSPARIATYSNPASAPTASLLKMLIPKSPIAGAAMASGRYCFRSPRARLTKGRMMSAA